MFAGGQSLLVLTDQIEYITMQSKGNAIDFGNLGSTRTIHPGGSSSTRAVWGGSYNAPGFSNVIEYVEIGTLGNALDFGDLTNSGIFNGVSISNSWNISRWIYIYVENLQLIFYHCIKRKYQ